VLQNGYSFSARAGGVCSPSARETSAHPSSASIGVEAFFQNESVMESGLANGSLGTRGSPGTLGGGGGGTLFGAPKEPCNKGAVNQEFHPRAMHE
jgi:hypothetical protein